MAKGVNEDKLPHLSVYNVDPSNNVLEQQRINEQIYY